MTIRYWLPLTAPGLPALALAADQSAPATSAPQSTCNIVAPMALLLASLTKGQHVARLVVHVAGQPDHVLPLITLGAVEPAGPIDRIANGLLGLIE